jgi:hypothetical protein
MACGSSREDKFQLRRVAERGRITPERRWLALPRDLSPGEDGVDSLVTNGDRGRALVIRDVQREYRYQGEVESRLCPRFRE